MYAYFGDFSCPNSTKMAKITWPVSMATRFKNHKSDTGVWLFALKDILCKFHQNRRLSISTYIGNSLQRSHFKSSTLFGHTLSFFREYINLLSRIHNQQLYSWHSWTTRIQNMDKVYERSWCTFHCIKHAFYDNKYVIHIHWKIFFINSRSIQMSGIACSSVSMILHYSAKTRAINVISFQRMSRKPYIQIIAIAR